MQEKLQMGTVIQKPLSVVWQEVKRRMTVAGYNQKTIWSYASIIKHLTEYMENNGFDVYTPRIGESFLSESPKIVTCPSLLNHLNLALSDVFWGTHYDTKNYSIVNSQLEDLNNRIDEDSMLAGISECSRKRNTRCICVLDIFLREYDFKQYSPEIGKQFLQCIEKASNVCQESFESVYRCNIARIDTYCFGERPFFKRGKDHDFINSALREYLEILIKRLSNNKYKNISSAQGVIAQLDQYMWDQKISCYTPEVGKRFVDLCQCRSTSQRRKVYTVSVIAHFDDVVMGRPFQKIHSQKQYTVPDGFYKSFKTYSDACIANGNSQNTLYKKFHICFNLFSELIDIGVSNVSDVTAASVIEICAKVDSSHWSCIREFLRCCAVNNLTDRNYSFFVPKEKSPLLIPPYYLKEEREKLEKAPNRETPIGKRDYAIILLANRLGLRSSDIAGLCFSEISQGKKTIDFEQVKTKTSHNLPLLPEIESAVMDYVNNGRPKSDSNMVFLSIHAPYDPITRRTIYYAITKYWRLAGVDTSGRKHGAHALRASLGTDLVNNGFTYNEAKHILGHRDANSTKHYAVIDMDNLRPCAGKPHPPGGNFEKFLSGEKRC